MAVTLQHSTPTLSKSQKIAKSKRQKRFDKLWSKVRNQQKSNEKLKTELDKLGAIYRERVFPFEQAAKMPIAELAERLIDFYRRKSLAQWQRDELFSWISDSIDTVKAVDSEKALQLQELLLTTVGDFHDVDMVQMKHDLEAEMEAAHKQTEEMDEEENDEPQGTFDFGEAADDLLSDDEDYDDPFAEFFEHMADEMKRPESKKMDDKWIKSIFRKTANALHPDKEQDPTRRIKKEKQMTALLKARDDNDIYSIINLYLTHVSDDTLSINDNSMDALCEQLENQLDQLLHDKQAITQYGDPVSQIVYSNLYGKNKKQQERAIADYLADLEQEKQTTIELTASLRNLKVLKIHLENRYDLGELHLDDPYF